MLSRFFPALPHFSLHQALTFVVFVGIVSAGFFAAFVLPIVGPEKFQTAVANATDLNKIAQSIEQVIPIGPSEPTNPIPTGPYCGDASCDEGESLDTCALDCFACNANGKCDVEIGENSHSCPTDCRPVTTAICDNDGICALRETTYSCPNDCPLEPIDPTPTDTNQLITQTCGNNSKEGTEICDGTALNSKTCITQGFASGTITCNASCTGFVTTACTGAPAQTCGNNIREGTETCDGTDLNSQTCTSKGYTGGELACAGNCMSFATGNCFSGTSVVLVPGSGWTSATAQPATAGDPMQPGYDAKAIARWDVVPYQAFDSTFNVGVVAFHINDIDRIEFAVNGGPWVAVRSMTKNPQTDVVEYWVTLRASDFPDTNVEVRAIAYPKIGIPRVLAGDSIAANGEHSLWLQSNANHSLVNTNKAIFVSPSGSDSTGDGNSAKPFQTISKALNVAGQSGTCQGATIYLKAGTYVYPTVAADCTGLGTARWLTLESDPAAGKANVIITDAVTAPDVYVRKLHVKNLTLKNLNNNYVFSRPSAVWGNFFWLDNVEYSGNGPVDTPAGPAFSAPPIRSGTLYYTDVYVHDHAGSVFNGALARNLSAYNVGGDFINSMALTVNASVDHMRHNDPVHADIVQIPTGSIDNMIIYGLKGTDVAGQGLAIGTTQPQRDIAVVNALLERAAGYGYFTWPVVGLPARHVVLRNITWIGYTYNVDPTRGGDHQWNYELSNSVIPAMSDLGDVNAVGWRVFNNHFTAGTASGSNFTVGDPMFADAPNHDYRPAAGSPLLGRVTQIGVPFDLAGLSVPLGGAIGAYQSAFSASASSDSTSPTILASGPSGAISAAYTSVALSVTTNELSRCRYSASPNQPFNAMTLMSTSDNLVHSRSVNVTAGTSYAYYVKCQDAHNNTTASDQALSFNVSSPGGGGPTGDITTSLLIQYPLDGNTLDQSGNGFDGSAAGAVFAAGKIGQAAQLNGSAYIGVGGGNALAFSPTSRFTLAAWVNPASSAEIGTIIGKASSTGYYLRWDGSLDALLFVADANLMAAKSATVFPESGEWVHVAAVFDSGTVTFYKNGSEAGSATGVAFTTSTAPFSVIGKRDGSSSSASFFAGGVDEVRVYGRALSADDVATLYAYGS
jgi:hypothetical protein